MPPLSKNIFFKIINYSHLIMKVLKSHFISSGFSIISLALTLVNLEKTTVNTAGKIIANRITGI